MQFFSVTLQIWHLSDFSFPVFLFVDVFWHCSGDKMLQKWLIIGVRNRLIWDLINKKVNKVKTQSKYIINLTRDERSRTPQSQTQLRHPKTTHQRQMYPSFYYLQYSKIKNPNNSLSSILRKQWAKNTCNNLTSSNKSTTNPKSSTDKSSCPNNSSVPPNSTASSNKKWTDPTPSSSRKSTP